MQQPDDFRQEVRAWLEQNCPQSMRTPMPESEVVWGGRNATFNHPDSRVWLERMADKGWTCPEWPAEYGGGGLDREQAIILQEEMQRIHARPPLVSFGISMLGPVLLEFGTHAQKLQHIPPIVRGEIRWCQGYSEPGAGSDLAGLGMKAIREGDQYRVNGQKIWTSYADRADWIFCLVRTDTEVPKHSGISFLLIDMATDGVSTRPIDLISGTSVFCETFFDDVLVPVDNLVGELNGGWAIAKRLLQHERTMISGFGLSSGRNNRGGLSANLALTAKQYRGDEEQLSDASLRDRIAQFDIDAQAFALTSQRSREESKVSEGPNATSSMLKNYGCELNKRRYELLLEAVGSQALGWESLQDGDFTQEELDLTRQWLRSKGNSIEGGTYEIQLNVIAKRVLGLPDMTSMLAKKGG
ncbi:MAG: acyl-CoA dehydrogenase family protein [Pseudohongiellaceae bacterium]